MERYSWMILINKICVLFIAYKRLGYRNLIIQKDKSCSIYRLDRSQSPQYERGHCILERPDNRSLIWNQVSPSIIFYVWNSKRWVRGTWKLEGRTRGWIGYNRGGKTHDSSRKERKYSNLFYDYQLWYHKLVCENIIAWFVLIRAVCYL